jgi:hypothetical protein
MLEVGLLWRNRSSRARVEAAYKVSETDDVSKDIYHKMAFRIALIIFLLSLVCAIGYITFYGFRRSEINLFESQFKSSVTQLQQSLNTNFRRTLLAGQELSFAVGSGANLSSRWPNATYNNFVKLGGYRLQLINNRAIALYTKVNSSQRAEFEAFAVRTVNDGLVEGTEYLKRNSWPIEKGIYTKLPNGTLVADDGLHNGYLFPNTYMVVSLIAPITLHNALMYNLMTDLHMRQALEYCLTYKNSSLTDVVQLAVDIPYRPSTQLYTPVLDNNDNVLGIISYSFSWDTYLSNILPDYILGLTIVMKTSTQVSSFHVTGKSCSYALGDEHDSAFDYLKQNIVLDQLGDPSISYQLSAYSTEGKCL